MSSHFPCPFQPQWPLLEWGLNYQNVVIFQNQKLLYFSSVLAELHTNSKVMSIPIIFKKNKEYA